MPRIKSAKKALRQNRQRAIKNRAVKNRLKALIKSISATNISQAFSVLDKAVKNNLLHKNKAARIKSRLTKAVGGPQHQRPGAGGTAKVKKKTK